MSEQIGLVSSFGQSAPFMAGLHMICGIESLPHACAIGCPSGPFTWPVNPVISVMPAAGSLHVHPEGQGGTAAASPVPLPAALAPAALAPTPAVGAAAAAGAAGAPALAMATAAAPAVAVVAGAPAAGTPALPLMPMTVVTAGFITAGVAALPLVAVATGAVITVEGVAAGPTAGALAPPTTPDGTELVTPGSPQATTFEATRQPATTNKLVFRIKNSTRFRFSTSCSATPLPRAD